MIPLVLLMARAKWLPLFALDQTSFDDCAGKAGAGVPGEPGEPAP
jgi:hypothetical protein